jgi:hypothetical protein
MKWKHWEYYTLVDVEIIWLQKMFKLVPLVWRDRPTRRFMFQNISGSCTAWNYRRRKWRKPGRQPPGHFFQVLSAGAVYNYLFGTPSSESPCVRREERRGTYNFCGESWCPHHNLTASELRSFQLWRWKQHIGPRRLGHITLVLGILQCCT